MAGRVAVVGSINADLVVRVERRPTAGETVLGSPLTVMAGGKGANQAAAAGRLGADITFVGCVGDDEHGRMLRARLKEAGVKTTGLTVSDRPSGTAIIMVTPDGENTIVVSPGANALVDRDMVEEFSDLWLSADVVAMQLEVPIDTAEHVAAAIARAGGRYVLNLAPATDVSAEMLAVCDPLVVNEGEAQFLLGGTGDLDDPAGVARALLDLGPRSVIVTLGAAGAIYGEHDGEVGHVPAREVSPVDTTGAGDAFVGALSAGLADGLSLKESVEQATDVAAYTVERHGAQASYPDRAELAARWHATTPAR